MATAAAPAMAPLPNSLQETQLKKTENCVFVITHFHMGIGKMRQIPNLKVETDADKSVLRHQKMLIDSPELEEIRSQDSKLRRWLDGRICRYSESMGFLPKQFLPEVDKVFLAYQTLRRPTLVKAFMEKYRELETVDFAPLREMLGEHFHRGDYPSSEVVEAGFSFTFAYKPVGDLRGLEGISDVIIARECEKEQAVRLQAVTEWRDALRTLGLGMVEGLFNVLKASRDGKRTRLTDAAVENLKEYLETFDYRDLAGDTDWQKQIGTLRKLMSGITVEKLRENETLKDRITDALGEVHKQMGALVQVTGRKFR